MPKVLSTLITADGRAKDAVVAHCHKRHDPVLASTATQYTRGFYAARGFSSNEAGSIQPHEARPRRDVGVSRQELQVPPALRPLQHDRACAPRNPTRDQELLLRSAQLHPADLVEPCEDVSEELKLWLHAEDRDCVPARVLDARVAVRDVDERFGEQRGRLGHEDLSCGHRGALWKPGRRDVEVRDEGAGGAVRGDRDLLLRQGARELVERVERVPFNVKQVVNMQYVVSTVDNIPLTAMCRGPLPAGWSIWPWTLNTPGAPSSTSLHTLSAPLVRVSLPLLESCGVGAMRCHSQGQGQTPHFHAQGPCAGERRGH